SRRQLQMCIIYSIYYYGAGIVSQATRDKIRNILQRHISEACEVLVETDLFGAARVLCGNNSGIACILGTGANSCLYDGEKIVDNVSALGYVLGDEGSGAVLGKLLVGDVLKRRLPKDLCEKFLKEYDLDMAKVVTRVYSQPGANRFLASLSPFLLQNIERKEIRDIVLRSFKDFFIRNISNYENYKEYPINFVGSIAHYYHDILKEAAEATGCRLGKVVQAPLEGLVEYHRY
ncbi:MAG: ATPase, partial [Muribaculaceae bacterium]|nr:ATPase [Muribaculaceae bacterium]